MTKLHSILALMAICLCGQQATAFIVSPSSSSSRGLSGTAEKPMQSFSQLNTRKYNTAVPEMPTIEQLSKDPFMKQIGHAEAVIELLSSQENEASGNQQQLLLLEELLTAQLSHSDGIRGFFVNYLTASESDSDTDVSSPADNPMVPEVLQKAMSKVDPVELVPLACMNVVMPTGMITMHEDPNLSKQSEKTSERGARILSCLMDNSFAKENCKAILAVATDGEDEKSSEAYADMVEYWTDFFEKWGYKEEEKKNISKVISNILKL